MYWRENGRKEMERIRTEKQEERLNERSVKNNMER